MFGKLFLVLDITANLLFFLKKNLKYSTKHYYTIIDKKYTLYNKK